MICPICQHEHSRVLHTDADQAQIKRRRECCQCRHRWNSFEVPEARITLLDDLLKRLGPVRELLP